MMRDGKLPYFRINGVRKIRGSDLERFIEEHPAEMPEQFMDGGMSTWK